MGYLFFFGLTALWTVTVVVRIALPPEMTVTIAVSLPNLASSARPVELSVSVSTFVAPAASVTPPLATTTWFVVVRASLTVAVIALIFPHRRGRPVRSARQSVPSRWRPS